MTTIKQARSAHRNNKITDAFRAWARHTYKGQQCAGKLARIVR